MRMESERKIKRFDEKYSEKGGFTKFQEMIDSLSTLEEIGQYFGFSRQNAAGLFLSFFGEGYNKVQKMRKEERDNTRLAEATDLKNRYENYMTIGKERSARKIMYAIVVKERAEELGLPVELSANKNSSIRTTINGYSVNISGTDTETIYHIPKKRRPSIYYRFAITAREVDYCIFVLDVEDDKYSSWL